MKLIGSEESTEALQSTGHHMMSPPSLARPKVGSIVVDWGDQGGLVDYSPTKKPARVEPVPLIHLIPLLMIFVFFILWAGSSEILPEEISAREIFATRMATTNKHVPSDQFKVASDKISRHGTRAVLVKHNHAPGRHKHHAQAHALSTNGRLSAKTYLRGVTR